MSKRWWLVLAIAAQTPIVFFFDRFVLEESLGQFLFVLATSTVLAILSVVSEIRSALIVGLCVGFQSLLLSVPIKTPWLFCLVGCGLYCPLAWIIAIAPQVLQSASFWADFRDSFWEILERLWDSQRLTK